MQKRVTQIYKVTLVGSVLNLILVVFKFVAGTLGRSSAMIADAVHSLTDFATDIIVIGFVRISNKPQDKNHDYGHGKYETIATAIIGIFLLAVGFGIAYNGSQQIYRVIQGETLPRPGWLAFMAAVLSLIIKEILFWYTYKKAKNLNSDVLVANAWHHRSDALSSIGTTIGIGGAVLLGSKWTVLDPIAAVAVSVLIIVMAWKLLRPAMDELLEKSLTDEIEDRIRRIALSFEGVNDFHNLRTRKIGNHYAMEFHLRMNPTCTLDEAHNMATRIEERLKAEFGEDSHVTVHMEPMY